MMGLGGAEVEVVNMVVFWIAMRLFVSEVDGDGLKEGCG